MAVGAFSTGGTVPLKTTTTSATTLAGTSTVTTGGTGGGTVTLADGTTINLSTNATTAAAQGNLASTEITASGQSKAQTDLATGYTAEQTAYTNAGLISGENAKVAGYAGDVLKYQEQLDVLKSTGEARAAAGAGGAAASGSVLDVLRSSLQQGALTQQLTQYQTALDIGGYLEQQNATQGESAAAGAQSKAATDLANTYSQLAAQASSQLKGLSTGTSAPAGLQPTYIGVKAVNSPQIKGPSTNF